MHPLFVFFVSIYHLIGEIHYLLTFVLNQKKILKNILIKYFDK